MDELKRHPTDEELAPPLPTRPVSRGPELVDPNSAGPSLRSLGVTPEPPAMARTDTAHEAVGEYDLPPLPVRPRLQPPMYTPDTLPVESLAIAPGSRVHTPAPMVEGPIVQPVSEKAAYLAPPPPQRMRRTYSDGGETGGALHYTRNPNILTAYLIPFPQPRFNPPIKPKVQAHGEELSSADIKRMEAEGALYPGTQAEDGVPMRFLIYTPPPPPLRKPETTLDDQGKEVKEGKVHKAQRKWEEEVRESKTKAGIKAKAIRGIAKGMSNVKSSNLEFFNRFPSTGSTEKPGERADKGVEELLLLYPPAPSLTPTKMREEFVSTLLRTKKKATRDAVISSALLPVSAAIDVLATPVWPFGGLLEIDGVWAYASLRGAKTARGVSKRLGLKGKRAEDAKTAAEGAPEAVEGEEMLKLTFKATKRLDVLRDYLASACSSRDIALFAGPTCGVPTESEILDAIGWTPSDLSSTGSGGTGEEEKWERDDVKDDLKNVVGKGAKEWVKWCKDWEKKERKRVKEGKEKV
ncbi:hypothetical protein YB2330_003053 [Saitoella coloradoensis]